MSKEYIEYIKYWTNASRSLSWPAAPPTAGQGQVILEYVKNLRAYCYVFENSLSQLPSRNPDVIRVFSDRTTELEAIMLHVGDDISIAIDHARNTHRVEDMKTLSTERRLLFDIFRKLRANATASGPQVFGEKQIPIKSEIARLADKRVAHRPERKLRKQIKRRSASRQKKRRRWIYISVFCTLTLALAVTLIHLNKERFKQERAQEYRGNHIAEINLNHQSGGVSIKLRYGRPDIVNFPESELKDPTQFDISWYADNVKLDAAGVENSLFIPAKHIPKHTKELHVVVTPILGNAHGPTVMSTKLEF